MLSILNFTLLAAAGAWVGAILFQSAIVAPSVFGVLDEPAARGFLRALFPRFFRFGTVCGGLCLLAALASGFVGGWHATTVSVAALSAAMAVISVVALAMIPAINAARDAGEAGHARFAALHRVSVALTILMLLIGLAIVALTVRGSTV
ncbi:MAG: DUF4149 domain-containing protein [Pseudomonadota bacterium]